METRWLDAVPTVRTVQDTDRLTKTVCKYLLEFVCASDAPIGTVDSHQAKISENFRFLLFGLE